MSIVANFAKTTGGNNSSKLTKCVAMAGLCTALLSPGALLADQVDWTQYAKSIDITFPGYTGSTTLTDFPVLVRLSAARNNFNYSTCQANGADLRFSDDAGNLIPHEIDTWKTDGESLVWVKVPSFNASTKITAHYGYTGSGQSPAVTASDVWSANYVGVWHLGENTLPMKESSGVSTDFSRANETVAYGVDGIVGGAVDFSTTTANNYLIADDDDDLDGFSDFTIEIWIYQDVFRTDGNFAALFAKRKGSSDQEAFFAYESNSGTTRNTAFCCNPDSVYANRSTIWASAAPPLGQWNYYAYMRAGATGSLVLYRDGLQNSTGTTKFLGPVYSGNATLKLGGGGGQQAFPGKIDEFRISKTVRSADWIKATNDCMTNGDFAEYVVENDWTQYSHKFSVTFSGYEGSETLSNFPALVKVSTTDIDGFSYADCRKPNGGDLRFADASRNLLASEVDTWNSNGVSLVWVKVPSLTTNTIIYAYYGWEFAPPVASSNVWANGYVGVWHMKESGAPLAESSGVSGPISTDSTGSKAVYGYTGAIGNAVNLSSAGWGHSLIAEDNDAFDGFADFTLEMWTKQNTWRSGQNNNSVLMAKRASGALSYYWYLNRANELDGPAGLLLSTNGTETIYLTGNRAKPEADAWTHQAFVRNTATNQCLVFVGTNTYSAGSQGKEPIFAGSGPLYIGGWTGAYAFPGQIDEVRISRVARSAKWIKVTRDTVTKAGFATYSKAKENGLTGLLILIR